MTIKMHWLPKFKKKMFVISSYKHHPTTIGVQTRQTKTGTAPPSMLPRYLSMEVDWATVRDPWVSTCTPRSTSHITLVTI